MVISQLKYPQVRVLCKLYTFQSWQVEHWYINNSLKYKCMSIIPYLIQPFKDSDYVIKLFIWQWMHKTHLKYLGKALKILLERHLKLLKTTVAAQPVLTWDITHSSAWGFNIIINSFIILLKVVWYLKKKLFTKWYILYTRKLILHWEHTFEIAVHTHSISSGLTVNYKHSLLHRIKKNN